jgi:tRNA U34 5-carboxymethylaminomethyl modifying GTPase MnmE/TrmE
LLTNSVAEGLNFSIRGEKIGNFFLISLELTSAPEESDRVLDLAAEELRTAITHIGRITGKVGIEEILDTI